MGLAEMANVDMKNVSRLSWIDHNFTHVSVVVAS